MVWSEQCNSESINNKIVYLVPNSVWKHNRCKVPLLKATTPSVSGEASQFPDLLQKLSLRRDECFAELILLEAGLRLTGDNELQFEAMFGSGVFWMPA